MDGDKWTDLLNALVLGARLVNELDLLNKNNQN